MALKLMYITKDPKVARIAHTAGVDRIFVDLEYIGKADRQGGMDTVQNYHTAEDVGRIRESLPDGVVIARVNPIHEETAQFISSEAEIDSVIQAGADIVMLPFFRTGDEVRRFLSAVGGRVDASLLIETPDAVSNIDEILSLPGISEVHIGLNDLSLGYGRKFLFELLADGTVEKLCRRIREYGIPYGFGGIARPGGGNLPAELIIREHCRLGSSCVILSRSFCNTEKIKELDQIESIFQEGVREVRAVEEESEEMLRKMRKKSGGARTYAENDPAEEYFEQNRLAIINCVRKITGGV